MTFKEFFSKIFSRFVWGDCLGVLVAGFALSLGALIALDFYTLHGEEVEVPDLKGQDIRVAQKKLEALGLRGEVSDSGRIASLPVGTLLDQSYAPGERVKPGRTIYLTINAARAKSLPFPNIAGNSSRREAEAKLTSLGFKLTKPEYVEGDYDWVFGVKHAGRSLKAGDPVPAEATLTLVVGRGTSDDEYNGNDSLDYLLNGDYLDETGAEIHHGEAETDF